MPCAHFAAAKQLGEKHTRIQGKLHTLPKQGVEFSHQSFVYQRIIVWSLASVTLFLDARHGFHHRGGRQVHHQLAFHEIHVRSDVIEVALPSGAEIRVPHLPYLSVTKRVLGQSPWQANRHSHSLHCRVSPLRLCSPNSRCSGL